MFDSVPFFSFSLYIWHCLQELLLNITSIICDVLETMAATTPFLAFHPRELHDPSNEVGTFTTESLLHGISLSFVIIFLALSAHLFMFSLETSNNIFSQNFVCSVNDFLFTGGANPMTLKTFCNALRPIPITLPAKTDFLFMLYI